MCQKELGADWLSALLARAGSNAGGSSSRASGLARACWMMMGEDEDTDVGLAAATVSGAGSSFTCTSV